MKIDKPFNQLMLIHMGKVLKNDAKLAAHNIKHNSVVHLVVRSAPDVGGSFVHFIDEMNIVL